MTAYFQIRNPQIHDEPEVKQAALDVLAYIKEHGWIQDSVSNKDGAVCLLGGIDRIDAPYTAIYGLKETIYAKIKSPISQWNDALGRTFEDVRQLLLDIAA